MALLQQCDGAVSLMSLPNISGTLLDTIPSGIPYLRPDPEKVEKWGKQLEHDHNFRIGFVWAGSANHQNDRNRSCPLEQFHVLVREGITLYSLQKGVDPGDLTKFGNGLIDLSRDLHDFTDTAAAVQNMDLIITVDTSVAHLAGAMNKPVWVLLPYASDWRWLVDREDSPWYPSAKLFRQTCPGDWETTFNNVVNTLAETVFNNGK
jgi:hypothetical protein